MRTTTTPTPGPWILGTSGDGFLTVTDGSKLYDRMTALIARAEGRD